MFESFKLPAKTLTTLDYKHYLEDLMGFNNYLNELGISTKHTRIERYIYFYETLIEKQDEFDPQTIFKNVKEFPGEHFEDWALYILREANELVWIYNSIKAGLKKKCRIVGLTSKLSEIVGGSDITALDQKTHSRNIQFELRIASYFMNAGYNIEFSELTDIIASRNRHTFYIECKRVENTSKITKRLGDAAKQLTKNSNITKHKKKTYSIIAIDVTKVAYPHNGVSFGFTPEMTRDKIQEKLYSIMHSINPNSFISDSTLMIWYQIHFPAFVLYPKPTNSTRISNGFQPNERKFHLNSKPFKLIDALIREANKVDSRHTKSEKLRPKHKIELPKGTVMWMDEDLLNEVMIDNIDFTRDQEEIVFHYIINEEKTEFPFIFVSMAINSIPEQELKEIRHDKGHIVARVAASLLLLSDPYEQG